ncbi:MAG: hypothetical protein JRF33_07830 [Deltaproteobacteria bacterium]|nr:hypothetical protein [Deltaproteobacteria bacterium]
MTKIGTTVFCFACLTMLACAKKAEDKSEQVKPGSPTSVQATQTTKVVSAPWTVADLLQKPAGERPAKIRLDAWLGYTKQKCSQKQCSKKCCNVCTGQALALGQPPGTKTTTSIPLLRKGVVISCQTRDCDWPKTCPHPPGRYILAGQAKEIDGKLQFEVESFKNPKPTQ